MQLSSTEQGKNTWIALAAILYYSADKDYWNPCQNKPHHKERSQEQAGCGHSPSHPTHITGEATQAQEVVEMPRKFSPMRDP